MQTLLCQSEISEIAFRLTALEKLFQFRKTGFTIDSIASN